MHTPTSYTVLVSYKREIEQNGEGEGAQSDETFHPCTLLEMAGKIVGERILHQVVEVMHLEDGKMSRDNGGEERDIG